MLLLDTHAFVWWITDSCRLSERAYALIADQSRDVVFDRYGVNRVW